MGYARGKKFVSRFRVDFCDYLRHTELCSNLRIMQVVETFSTLKLKNLEL